MGEPPQGGSPLPPPGIEPSFEASLERLEGLVVQLEDGSLELEAALAAFEEGVRLTRQCAEQLAAAERRLEVLSAEGGELVVRPLDVREGGA